MNTSPDALSEFKDRFKLDKYSFHRTEGWILSVRPEQITLGSMILSSAKGKVELSQLDDHEGAELAYMFGVAEKLAKDEFGALRINILCLMMKDPLVHFHIIPRYAGMVEYDGIAWFDKDYPSPPSITPISTNDGFLTRMVEKLSSQF